MRAARQAFATTLRSQALLRGTSGRLDSALSHRARAASSATTGGAPPPGGKDEHYSGSSSGLLKTQSVEELKAKLEFLKRVVRELNEKYPQAKA